MQVSLLDSDFVSFQDIYPEVEFLGHPEVEQGHGISVMPL